MLSQLHGKVCALEDQWQANANKGHDELCLRVDGLTERLGDFEADSTSREALASVLQENMHTLMSDRINAASAEEQWDLRVDGGTAGWQNGGHRGNMGNCG